MNKHKWILIGMTLLVTPGLHAQYVIPWYTMDSGGGTSSGGAYELSGTIGQSDVGKSAGGDYELVAGFWAFAFVVQGDAGPKLKIRYLSPTEALIYWDADAPPAILQRSTDLADAAGWTDDPGTPVFEDGEYRLIVTPLDGIRFYRLRMD